MKKDITNRQDYYEAIKQATTWQKIRSISVNYIKFLRENHTNETVKSYVSKTRMLCKRDPDKCLNQEQQKFINKYLLTPKDISDSISENYNHKVNTSNKEQIILTREIVNVVFPNIFKELLVSNHRWEVCTALGFYTGRRPAEIMQNATITLLPEDHYLYSTHVYFDGQRKRRDNINDPTSFIIPVLGDPKIIVKHWNRLIINWRDDYKNLDFTQFNQRQSKQSQYMRDDFQGPFKITPYDLRKIYACLCCHFYKDEFEEYKDKKYSDVAYLGEILGHGEKDITTANVYNIYRVENV